MPARPRNLAIKDSDHDFYNVTVRNFAQPMSNKPQSLFVPLNDYTATIIGMVRDNVPFNTVLSADLIYIGNGSLLPNGGLDAAGVSVQQRQPLPVSRQRQRRPGRRCCSRRRSRR